MRVAFVTPVVPHPRPGFYRSIERMVHEELARLGARHDLRVFTTFWNGGAAEDAYLGVPVTRVVDSSTRFGRAGRLFDLDYATFGRRAVAAIRRFGDFDVVHSLGRLPGSEALLRDGVPVVQHFHHKESVESARDLLRIPFATLGDRRSYRRASRVTSSSAHGAEVLTRAWGVDPARVRVAYPGVAVPEVAERVAHEGFRVLFVGTLTKRKGARVLLDALRLLPGDVRATLVGVGPEEASLHRQAAALRGRVAFERALSEEALDRVYATADVLALPSFVEGFGMVSLEAMARGVPVVGSAIPPIREAVGEAGILVPPGDPGALAEALARLRDDPVLARRLGDAGRRAAARFPWDGHVEALERTWKEVVP